MEDFIVELTAEEDKVRQVIEPLLESEGYELVSMRLKRAQTKAVLALFVDTLNVKNGIVLENLTEISRLLSDVLDASFQDDSVLRGHYDLEVSSPGLDRPLSKLSHFTNAKDERVRLRLKEPLENGAKNVLGRLIDANDEGIVLELDDKKDEHLEIKYQNLLAANIIFDFTKFDKHKKKP